VRAVQARLLEKQGELKGCLEDPVKLHLTLTVLRIEGEGQAAAAVRLLEEALASEEARALASGRLSLRFARLGAFGNRVLFAEPEGEHLPTVQQLARCVWVCVCVCRCVGMYLGLCLRLAWP
jgi:2'-5' RNA ligase